MDDPSLKEISDKEENFDIIEKDFYFKEIIPIIISNVKFFIFMLDVKNIKVVTKFNEKNVSTILENSLYIVNKIDFLNENKVEKNELHKNFIGVI